MIFLLFQVFQDKPEFLENRFPDQLIICTVYGIFKLNKQEFETELKFTSLLDKFQENLTYFNKPLIQKYSISGNDKKTIIDFYNDSFAVYTREK